MIKRAEGELEIIALAKEGNSEATTQLYERYSESLLLFLSNMLPTKEDAEDIVQESFKRAFKNISRYNSRYAFSTWLFAIGQNCALDQLRKRRIPSLREISPYQFDYEKSEEGSALSPEELMINRQAIETLVRALHQLPKLYREIAELRFIQGYPLEEISKELGIPLNTVKTRVSRAKRVIEEIWKR